MTRAVKRLMRNDAYVSKWKIIKSMEHLKDEENKLYISNMFHHSSSVSVTSRPVPSSDTTFISWTLWSGDWIRDIRI